MIRGLLLEKGDFSRRARGAKAEIRELGDERVIRPRRRAGKAGIENHRHLLRPHLREPFSQRVVAQPRRRILFRNIGRAEGFIHAVGLVAVIIRHLRPVSAIIENNRIARLRPLNQLRPKGGLDARPRGLRIQHGHNVLRRKAEFVHQRLPHQFCVMRAARQRNDTRLLIGFNPDYERVICRKTPRRKQQQHSQRQPSFHEIPPCFN